MQAGLYAYQPTPFGADERVDLRRLRQCAEAVLAEGVDGITCLASTCEGPYLTDHERRAVVEELAKVIPPGIGFNVGVGAYGTRQVIEHALHARDHGATSIMVEVQQYFPVSFPGIAEHFERVRAAAGMPIRLYNLPGPGRPDLSPEQVAHIVQSAQIRSVKDASGDVERIRRIRELCGSDLAIQCGLHFQLLDGMRLGADGWEVMMHPCFCAELVALYRLVRSDPWSTAAEAAFANWLPLFRLFRAFGVPQCVKSLAAATEFPLGPLRSPLAQLGPAAASDVRDAHARAMSK